MGTILKHTEQQTNIGKGIKNIVEIFFENFYK